MGKVFLDGNFKGNAGIPNKPLNPLGAGKWAALPEIPVDLILMQDFLKPRDQESRDKLSLRTELALKYLVDVYSLFHRFFLSLYSYIGAKVMQIFHIIAFFSEKIVKKYKKRHFFSFIQKKVGKYGGM